MMKSITDFIMGAYDFQMATSINQEDFLKTALRLPRDLHARILEVAGESGRSMNSEIVARLQASLADSEPPASGRTAPSGVHDDLLNAVLTLSALRAEKGVYELRLDLAAATKRQITNLAEMAQRLKVIDAEIASCELIIERFKGAVEKTQRLSKKQ